VTAVNVPPGVAWPALNAALRRRGLVVGGNYGPLDGKVFRLGHMGTQADEQLVERALAALAEALHETEY
jgi:aspartate aminotransferase-like enzyme